QAVTITSNSSNAIIYKNGSIDPIASNKQTFYLEPFVDHTLTVKAQGYEDATIKIKLGEDDLGNNNKINITQKRTSIIQDSQHLSLPPFNMKMIFVPPGSFTMGSNNFLSEEKPAFQAQISQGFWIAESEVTQQLYESIMNENPSGFVNPNNPVERVSWHKAMEFCKKYTSLLQKQNIILPTDFVTLPTEAQWEYAAKAGLSSIFTFGDNLTSSQANFDGLLSFNGEPGQYKATTVAVKSYPPNKLGLYDMHGNVFEWCLDNYRHGHQANSSEANIDHSGPANNTGEHVLKGGSWKSYAKNCRISSRYNRPASAIDNRIGFRFVIVIKD
ncbi:MAG: SUMF1/EgtB/PvdO family nonheme iron enzyme, partial [Lentisphaeria bacterium]